MSLGRPNGKSAEPAVPLLSNGQFLENMRYLDHLQAEINRARAMTNAGREQAEQVKEGLRRMAEDGKTAERLLAAMDQAENNEQIFTMLSPSAINFVTAPRPSLLPPPVPNARPQLPYTQSPLVPMQPQHSNYTQSHPVPMQPQHSNYQGQSYPSNSQLGHHQPGHYRPANHSHYGQTAFSVAPVSTLPTPHTKPSQSPVALQTPTAQHAQHARPTRVSPSSLDGALGKEDNRSASPKTAQNVADAINSVRSSKKPNHIDESHTIQTPVTQPSHNAAPQPHSLSHSIHPLTQSPLPTVSQGGNSRTEASVSQNRPSFTPTTHQILVKQIRDWMENPKSSPVYHLPDPNFMIQRGATGFRWLHYRDGKYEGINADEVWHKLHLAGVIQWPSSQEPQSQPFSRLNEKAPQTQPSSNNPPPHNQEAPQMQPFSTSNGNTLQNQSSMAPDVKASIKSNDQALQNGPSTSDGKALQTQPSSTLGDKVSTNDGPPSTPKSRAPQNDGPVRSPQDANKKTLARDILRALVKPASPSPPVSVSGKRSILSVSSPAAEPAPKKRAVESRQDKPWQAYQPFSVVPFQPTMRPTMSTWNSPTATVPYNPSRSAEPLSKVIPSQIVTSSSSTPTSSQSTASKPVTTEPPSQSTTATPSLPPLLSPAIPNTVGFSSLLKPAVEPLSRSSLPAPPPANPSENAVSSDTRGLLDSSPAEPAVRPRRQSVDTASLTPPLLPSTKVNSEKEDLSIGNSATSTIQPHSSSPAIASTAQNPSSPPRAQTPLFLPSPSPGRVEGPPESTKPRYVSQNRAYVDVPMGPDWVKRYQRRKPVRAHQESLDSATLAEVNTVLVDPKEKRAIEESFSRLRGRRCEWKRCDGVSNSANSLLRHLAGHEEEQLLQKSFTCGWHQCGKQFLQPKDFHIHVERHARNPIYCPYSDCEESFRTGHQLMQHTASHRADRLRPDTRPTKLPKPDHMPDISEEVPAYMIEARAVAPCSISPARHQVLGRWVLRNIFAPLEVPQRYNAAKPLRSSRKAEADTSACDYEFLAFSSTYTTDPSEPPRKIKDLCDLNSSDVSQMAYEGLVLWPPDVKVEEVEDSKLI